MNSRERTMLIVLVALVATGVLALGVWQWFVKPLRELNAKIDDMKDKNGTLEGQLETFQRDKKKLDLARRRSLSANPVNASAYYMNYLQSLFREAGLNTEQLTPSAAVEMKAVSTIPGIKKVGHQVLSFQVRAKGDLKQLMKALELLQRTPYEHRIKKLTIDRVDTSTARDAGSRLAVNMTIEALLVSKTPNKSSLPPGIDPAYVIIDAVAARSGAAPVGWGVLASMVAIQQTVPRAPDYRHYAEVYKKNIFVGAVPVKPPPPPTKDVPPGSTPPPEYVPRYIRLTMTNTLDNEAYFSNLVYDRPIHRMLAQKRGYDTYRITDEDGAYTFFEVKILRIDPRAVYFQARDKEGKKFHDKIYGIPVGLSFEQAVHKALSTEQIKALDLQKLYDEKWGKEPASGKKSYGGFFKKGKGG